MAESKNGFWQLAKDLDRVAASVVFDGPIRASIKIVHGLQDKGPSWSGRFSNSWVIKTPSKVFKSPGFRQEGEPIRFKTRPTVTGREATASHLLKDSIIFEIYNDSPKNFSGVDYKAYALDQKLGCSRRSPRWGLEPKTQKGRAAYTTASSGRKVPSMRGDIGGGLPSSTSSRTAVLDWFPLYIKGGELNRAIRVEMDSAFEETKRRTQGRLK